MKEDEAVGRRGGMRSSARGRISLQSIRHKQVTLKLNLDLCAWQLCLAAEGTLSSIFNISKCTVSQGLMVCCSCVQFHTDICVLSH